MKQYRSPDDEEEDDDDDSSDLEFGVKAKRSQNLNLQDHAKNLATQISNNPEDKATPVISISHNGFVDPEENLDDDFEDTPWLPPSIEKAAEYKKNTIFRGGDVRLNSVNILNAPDLGPGVILYFQFAMTMAISLLFMTLLSIPSLAFSYAGSRIQQKNKDAFGLYRLTLGNVGYDVSSTSYWSDAKCTTPKYISNNDTCLQITSTREISLIDAASFLTACEFIQMFCFYCGVLYLYRRSVSIDGKKQDTSISDYAIQVKNIPDNTTEEELGMHFSKLYQLNKVDWRQRPIVEQSRPVQTSCNINDSRFVHTWVAECVVHKKIGRFISVFRSKQHLMEKLYKCRALMKMYGEGTPHSGGYNQKKFIQAEFQMIKTGTLIDTLTEKSMKVKGLKMLDKLDPKTKNINIYHNIEAKSDTGFIVFEYAESLARCIDDFDRFSRFPMSIFYPNVMKFKGRRLVVSKAPEPDQIIFENLEITNRKRLLLTVRTTMISIFLIIIAFFIILQASIYENQFSSDIPVTSLCKTDVPSLYYNISSRININNAKLVRPSDTAISKEYDISCSNMISGSFYAVYTTSNNYLKPISQYSFDACQNKSSSSINICPKQSETIHCPCVTTDKKDLCLTAQCDISLNEYGCKSFKAGQIGACYCYNELTTSLANSGVIRSLQSLNLRSGPCRTFYASYSLAEGLKYAAVIVNVVVAFLLTKFLVALTKQEKHYSGDAEQGSLVTKIFLANYMIMSVIVLAAYGSISNLPSILKTFHIFDGIYSDFDSGWYGDVGFYFVTSFFISSFSSLFTDCCKYYIYKPWLRSHYHKQVRQLKSTKMVMQNDLNKLEVGQIFDATKNTAQLLTLLFFAMTYAPGIPLLMPLCCAAFVCYFRVDKFLICRYYSKPPHFGAAAIRIVVEVLPYAAVIRLAFACWMFGNPNIFPDPTVPHEFPYQKYKSNSYVKFLIKLKEKNIVPNYLSNRIFRTNVFPLFCLFLIIVASLIIRIFWKELPIYWFLKFLKMIQNFCVNRNQIYNTNNKNKQHKMTHKINDNSNNDDDDEDENNDDEQMKQQNTTTHYNTKSNNSIHPFYLTKLNDPLRQEMAPFTGDYFKYIKHKDEIPDTCFKMFKYHALTKLDEKDVEEGWCTEDKDDFVVKVKKWTETFQTFDG